MTAALVNGGLAYWAMTRDNDGHRNYTIRNKVYADVADGPAIVANTPGLPLIGSLWNFGNDADLYAYCQPDMTIKPVKHPEPNHNWIVEQKFSTKPMRRCQDDPVEDPLLEPQRIGGTFTKGTTEPGGDLTDKDGKPILTISFERYAGLTFDKSNHQVSISQNIGTLELETLTDMIDTVNEFELWGYEARRVKLSQISWTRKVIGTCGYYYTRDFGFEVLDREHGWDRNIVQYSQKTLRLGGNILTPEDWEIHKDHKDDNDGDIPLNALGKQATSEANIARKLVQYYPESDFLLLGIPTEIGN
jgi:hypothetical protein